MLKIWTQGLLNWTQDLNLGIWEKPWVGIHCARNRQTTQDRQGTIKYLDTLAMRKNRQVSCEADKRQDLHGTLARGGVNRGIRVDCTRNCYKAFMVQKILKSMGSAWSDPWLPL